MKTLIVVMAMVMATSAHAGSNAGMWAAGINGFLDGMEGTNRRTNEMNRQENDRLAIERQTAIDRQLQEIKNQQFLLKMRQRDMEFQQDWDRSYRR